MSTYYTVVTDVGQQKIAAHLAGGPQVQLTHMAVGDGNGNPITPNATMTTLVRERFRSTINDLSVANPSQKTMLAELVIPAASGGWAIHEVGLFDTDGDLIAVANFPGTYKPSAIEGATRDLLIWMYIQVSNTSAVTIVVDPNLVVATRVWATSQFSLANQMPGGTTHQVLRKRSNTDGDVEWADLTDGITLLVGAIEEHQTLASGQTTITLSTVTTNGLAVYVEGARLRNDQWVEVSFTEIQLLSTYPVGSKVTLVQNEPAGQLIDPLQAPLNLSDLDDPATARTNLGLGTAATRNAGTTAGNVLEVGAFGLGGTATLVSPVENIDTITATGFCSVNSASGGTKPTGASAFVLQHIQRIGSPQYRVQIASATGSLNAETWIRSHNGTTWGSWFRVYTEQNFNPNDKVSKSGDTMTGNLTLPIVVANTQIQVGSNGNGSSIVYFYDDNANIYRPFFWSAAGNDWFCHDRFSLEQRVWHSGNDGAGSGLDADLLDGLQASQLARTDTAETFASNVTVQGKLQVGKDGAGNSIIEFYDDNSNVWRSFFWNNANNRWEAHDNSGTAHPVVTGVNFMEVSDFLYGLSGSKGANGWQKLPGGLILQWGVNTASISSGGTVGVTFPTAFPNACLHMQSTSRNAAASGGADIFMQIVSYSQGGATLYVQSNISATTSGFFWFAIGY